MDKSPTKLGLTVRLHTDYETALRYTIEALKTEGFGVLTEIDVRETFKKKIDVDFRPYKILGACNPSLAHRALTIAPEAGLLLPCNVTVAYIDEYVTEVSLINPIVMLAFLNVVELEGIAKDAYTRLERVRAALQQA